MDRTPFQITTGAVSYEGIDRLPVTMLLDNVRSLYNVGSFFRTADGVRLSRLFLCGITAQPPRAEIAKTALGAEETVPWEYHYDTLVTLRMARARGMQIAAIETGSRAVDLFDWRPQFPVCVVFGNEVEGLTDEVLEACDVRVRLPMLGLKHSLNVATAAGVVAYELLRKYRRLLENHQ